MLAILQRGYERVYRKRDPDRIKSRLTRVPPPEYKRHMSQTNPWNPTGRPPPRKVWVTCSLCAGKLSGFSCGPSHQPTYARTMWPASEFLPTPHPEGVTPGVCPCDTGSVVRWYPSSRKWWGEDYGPIEACDCGNYRQVPGPGPSRKPSRCYWRNADDRRVS